MDYQKAKQICRNTLASDAHWQVNKTIARKFSSCNTAVLLAELLSMEILAEQSGEITKHGFFPIPIAVIEHATGINRSKQDTILQALIASDIIVKMLMGTPAKRCIKINHHEYWGAINNG